MTCCLQTCGVIAVGVASIAYLAYRFVLSHFNPRVRFNAAPSKHVLITGASSGIGADAAISLALAGFTVHAGVRKDADAKKLVAALEGERNGAAKVTKPKKGEDDGAIVPITIDVASEESVASAAAELSARVGADGLGALVNNAGVIVAGPLEFLPLSKLRQQLDINVVGQVSVTQAMLPLLRKGGKGARIVFTSSLAGKTTVPFNGAYAASKHALESISDAFRRELAVWGISVSVIEPGMVDTAIIGKSEEQTVPSSKLENKDWAHYYGAYHDNPPKASKRNIAPVSVTTRAIEDAIVNREPKTRYVVGAPNMVKQFKMSLYMPDRYIDATFFKRSWPGRNKSKVPVE